MYKVMVIDDEPWILKWFQALPIWEGSGFSIVAQSTSPVDALRLARKTQPHVIFTDIRMAEMNGFDFVRQVQTILPESRIVFMTACDDFADAAQALQLHAFDYMLKPVADDRLIELLKELRRFLDEQQSRESAANRMTMAHTLLNAFYAEDYCTAGELFGPLMNHRQAVVAIVQGQAEEKQIEEALKALEQASIQSVYTRAGTHRYILLLTAPEIGSKEISMLEKCLSVKNGQVGVSMPFSGNDVLLTFYHQAEEALENTFIAGEKQSFACWHRETGHGALLLEEMKELRSADEMTDWLQQLEARLQGMPVNAGLCWKLFGKLLVKIASLTGTPVEYEWGGRQDFLQTFGSLHDMIDFLLDACKPAGREKNQHNEGVIEEIIQDLRQHYAQPLRLTSYARQYAFNYSYMSTLFKKHTGKSFVTYLVELRLQKAQELMQQTNLPIHEISEMVGYDDYHYFSRLFKKYTGMSPSRFAGRAE